MIRNGERFGTKVDTGTPLAVIVMSEVIAEPWLVGYIQ